MSYDVKTGPNFKITERPNGRTVENPQEMTLKKGQTMWGFAQEHARKDFNMSPTDLLKSVGDLNPSLNGDFTKIKEGTQVIQLPPKVKEVDLDNKPKEAPAPAAPVEKDPAVQAQARGKAAAADTAAQKNLARTETVAKTAEKKPVKGLQKGAEEAKPASIDKEIGDVQAKVDGVAAKQGRIAELDKKISHELSPLIRKDDSYLAGLTTDLPKLLKERESLANDAKDAQKSLKSLEAKLPGAAADLNSLVGKKRNELAAAPASKREALERELAPLEKSLSTVQGLQLGGAKGMAETLDTHLSTLDKADKGLASLSTTVSEHQAAVGRKLKSKLDDEKETLSDLQGQAALPREKRDGAVRGSMNDDELKKKIGDQQGKVDGLASDLDKVNTSAASPKLGDEKKTLAYLEGQSALPRAKRDPAVRANMNDDELKTKVKDQKGKVDGLATDLDKANTSAAVNTASAQLGDEKKTLGYLEGQLALPRGQRDATVRSNMNDDELKTKVKDQKGKVDGLAAEIEKLKAQMATGGGGG